MPVIFIHHFNKWNKIKSGLRSSRIGDRTQYADQFQIHILKTKKNDLFGKKRIYGKREIFERNTKG